MDHTEYAAEVNESAVACERLNNALVTLADFAVLPEFLALSGSLLLEHAADRTDSSFESAALRNLDKSEVYILTDEVFELFVAGSCCL